MPFNRDWYGSPGSRTLRRQEALTEKRWAHQPGIQVKSPNELGEGRDSKLSADPILSAKDEESEEF